MLSNAQLVEAFDLGREQSAIEFKSPGPKSDARLLAQVVRAMLAMSNRRDGGYVIVGVAETDDGIMPIGVDMADLGTWSYDDLADSVSRFADPSVAFDLRIVSISQKSFVVIHVSEFVEAPTLCKRDYNDGKRVVLREGACYVRPRRKPETVEVSTYADMRDLLDLAIEKGLRRFVGTAERVGWPPRTVVADRDRFDQQIVDFL